MTVKKKSTAIRRVQAKPKAVRTSSAKPLLTEVRTLILAARAQVAQTVNAGLTLLYWNIGTLLFQNVPSDARDRKSVV